GSASGRSRSRGRARRRRRRGGRRCPPPRPSRTSAVSPFPASSPAHAEECCNSGDTTTRGGGTEFHILPPPRIPIKEAPAVLPPLDSMQTACSSERLA